MAVRIDMPSLHRKSMRLFLLGLIAVACVGCDQATKKIAEARLRQSGSLSYFGDTLRLQYAENPGGFLGLGGRLPTSARFTFLILFNTAVLIGVTWAVVAPAHLNRSHFLALALILTGGIGNLVDRVANEGLVTDFLNLGIGPVRTGIFNVADVAISAGCAILALTLFRAKSGERAKS